MSVFAASPALAQETATPPQEAAAVVQQVAAVQPVRGQMILTSDGSRLGRVYRVADDGAPSVIFNGRLIIIPAATISADGDNLVTTLTRREIATIR